jgi:hypothetical protein
VLLLLLLLALLFGMLMLLLLTGPGRPAAVMRVCSSCSLLSVATWPILSRIEPLMGL